MDDRLRTLFPGDSLGLPRAEWAELRKSIAKTSDRRLTTAETARLRELRTEAMKAICGTVGDAARTDGTESARIVADRTERRRAKKAVKSDPTRVQHVADRRAANRLVDARPPTAGARQYLFNKDCHYSLTATAGEDCPVPLHPDFEPERYGELLDGKRARIQAMFEGCFEDGAVRLEVAPSMPLHFRLRCKFGVHRTDDGAGFCYRVGPNSPELTAFPVASVRINELMPKLLAELQARPELARGLTAAHFLTALGTASAAITLVYRRQTLVPAGEEPVFATGAGAAAAVDATGDAVVPVLEATWRAAATAAGAGLGTGVSLIAQAHGVRWVCGTDFIDEVLTLEDGGGAKEDLRYRQAVGSFSNPNGHVNVHSLNWLRSCCAELGASKATGADDSSEPGPSLLELYCGCGNHTVALATRFDKVVAVELDPSLVEVARHNLAQNQITNATVLHMAAGDFALCQTGPNPNAAAGGDDAATAVPAVPAVSGYDAVLLDPPRAGLDADTMSLASRFENILIISCNQAGLLASLQTRLLKTHRVRRFTLMDHFPYTAHTECGVWLTRRKE